MLFELFGVAPAQLFELIERSAIYHFFRGLFLPFRPEPFIEEIAQLIEKQFPGRLTLGVGTQKFT